MKKYEFNLQKLLNIREEQVEESKIKFKEAKIEKEKVQDKLESLNQEYHKYTKKAHEGTTIDKKLTWFYLEGMSINIKNTNQELIYKDKVLSERREDLKEKKIKSKTVEILKQKDYQRFTKTLKQQEQKENDEFAISGFVRRIQGGE
ncbi:MAG: flagellar export protein FliJ [Bacillota bacterium]|nr:flagellar export protein FliJ [Bacillota bacterium]